MGESRSVTRGIPLSGARLWRNISHIRRYLLLGTVAALSALPVSWERTMASVVIEGIDEHPVPGNLKAHFCGNTLLLPKGVVDVLRKDGVRTAEDLMSYIQAFPSGVADSLRWSISDVNNAAV